MSPGEFVVLIALPISVAAVAVLLNRVSLVKSAAAVALISLVCGIAALAMLGRTPTDGDFVVWMLVSVLPIAMAFLAARWHAVRTRRMVAATVAVVAYVGALLLGVNIGMAAGVLVH